MKNRKIILWALYAVIGILFAIFIFQAGVKSSKKSGDSTTITTDLHQTDKTNNSVVTDVTAQEQSTTEPSPASSKYAKELGGTSHKDKMLFFIIGATEQNELAARKRIADALPSFGDMQSYFIAEPSSHFDGFKPGYWVVIEAYRDKENAEQSLDFARRAFKDSYIKQATVKCSDPIPVYEELTPGLDQLHP